MVIIATLSIKVPSQDMMHSTSSAWGSTAWGAAAFGAGGVCVDLLLLHLRNIFKPGDVEHVFQAVKNDCSHFLTLDKKTIILPAERHRDELNRLCPNMKFVMPVELEQLLAQATLTPSDDAPLDC